MVRRALFFIGLTACTMNFDAFLPGESVDGTLPGRAGSDGGEAADPGDRDARAAFDDARDAGATDAGSPPGSPPAPDGSVAWEAGPHGNPTCDEPGLLARWKFDGDARDCTSTHLDGTVYGNETYFQGHTDGALYFDGSAYVSLGNSAATKMTGAFTITGWIESVLLPTVAGSAQWVIGKGQNIQSTGWRFSVEPASVTNFVIGRGNNVDPVAAGCSCAKVGAFNHFAVIFEPNVGARIYINGILIDQDVIAPPSGVIDSPYELRIGARGDGFANTYFKGYLDDLRIYSRVLFQSEIQGLASQ